MVNSRTDFDALVDATVFDSEGKKVGTVGAIYLDDHTQQPAFVSVNTGLFGMKETFIPFDAANRTADGLTVPFTKDFIKDAPNVDADGHLSPDEERRVFDHYKLAYDAPRVSTEGAAGDGQGAAGDHQGGAVDHQGGAVGHAGPTGLSDGNVGPGHAATGDGHTGQAAPGTPAARTGAAGTGAAGTGAAGTGAAGTARLRKRVRTEDE